MPRRDQLEMIFSATMCRITCIERLQIPPHGLGRCISFPGRFGGLEVQIAARVATHETSINREAFAGNEASLPALPDNYLKQNSVNVAIAKPAIAVLGDGRMIWHGSSSPSRQNQR